jgi:hypothetical protein
MADAAGTNHLHFSRFRPFISSRYPGVGPSVSFASA